MRTVFVLVQEDHGPARVFFEAKFVLSDTMLFRGSGGEAFVTPGYRRALGPQDDVELSRRMTVATMMS